MSTKDHTLLINVNNLKKKTNRIEFLLDDTNLKVTDDLNIAELLAKNDKLTHKATGNIRDPPTELLVETSLTEFTSSSPDNVTTYESLYLNLDELKDIILKFENKNAPGDDDLQGILIKRLPDNILETLIDIFNSFTRNSHFPDN